MSSQPDLLDKSVAFLAKREGIDKVLKILRYSARLVVAVGAGDPETLKRFDALQSSIGVSRKAFRLGKFLQDVQKFRKVQRNNNLYVLEYITLGGEGLYYFVEQFTWLVKTGFLPKPAEKPLGKLSAWAEMVGYIFNVILQCEMVRQMGEKEAILHSKVLQRQRDGEVHAELDDALALLRAQRYLRVVNIVQDCSDALIALNDIRDVKGSSLAHPILLSLAGLVSAAISTYKNWNC